MAVVSSCAHSRQAEDTVGAIGRNASGLVGGTATALPKAIIYRTQHDYSNNVSVTMNTARTEIVSYPAPSDLRRGDGYATPLPLANGYWLDRRGVNANSVFLDYTFQEYASLEVTPTVAELKEHIIDRQPFTAMYALPLTASTAERDTAQCNNIILGGMKGCNAIIKPLPTLSR